MRVLVGCEESGVVRRAFRALGHDAWSCDVLPPRDHDVLHHYQDDVREIVRWYQQSVVPFDLAIFFTPCTNLSGSGARWMKDHWVHKNGCPGNYARHHLKDSRSGGSNPFHCRWHDGTKKRAARAADLALFRACFESGIPRIAMENPVGMLSSLYRKPDQIIQPWQFGHGETKATCLWLKNLPPLKPTRIVEGREQRIWKMAPGPNRQRDRSETYQGIADAMAAQWGGPASFEWTPKEIAAGRRWVGDCE